MDFETQTAIFAAIELAKEKQRMSNHPTFGALLGPDDHRDAVHMAVAPVTAAVRLSPGQHIGIGADGRADVVDKPIGIVDPFLLGPVFRDERFWIFLYPGTITALRHEWSHPSFSESDHQPTNESREWLAMFANKAGLSFGALIEAADLWVREEEYQCQGGKWEGFYTPDAADAPETERP